MNMFRILSVGAIVCAFTVGARAEDKVDYAKLIVGKWEVTKAAEETIPAGTIVEFTKDGKFKIIGKKDDKDINFEGTYTVEKDTFTFILRDGDMEHKETITITKMSAKEMSTKNKSGKVVDLKKS